jgi:ribose/xylose/arabinose/galactoside ABC-type transport system permease subunit
MIATEASHASLRPSFSTLRRHAPVLIVYTLIIILCLIGTIFSERFLTERNLFNVVRQTAFLGVVALGQTIVILTAGIDLSVGSLVKLSLLTSAILIDGDPGNIPIGVAGTLALGVLVGTIHALIITRLGVSPFIVTLGTFSIMRGISLMIATGPVGRASPGLLLLYDRKLGPLPLLFVFFMVLIILAIVMLRRTTFGRYIYAIGGNEEVARLSGIQVDRVKFGVYILSSLLASVTGLLYLSRMGIGDPVVGDGLELRAITAVIIGGTSLFGGRGSIIGTLGGVLLIGLTANLLVVLNVNRFYQELIQGAIIVGAVALYRQEGRQ